MLQKFIQQFRGLLAIILLCVVTISSFCALTLSEDKKTVSELDNLLTTLLASVQLTSPRLNNSVSYG